MTMILSKEGKNYNFFMKALLNGIAHIQIANLKINENHIKT